MTWHPTATALTWPFTRPDDPGMPLDDSLAELHLWDPWPVLTPDGCVADVFGEEWWIALTAPRTLHPEARHDHARLRWLRLQDAAWYDGGPVFPDGASPGSREWSGTAVYDAATFTVRVLYTASGTRGDWSRSFRQRMYEARATVTPRGVGEWSPHVELLPATEPFLSTEPGACPPELCRAYRDPYFFRDPITGSEHLLFAASLADPAQVHAGAVGLATWTGDGWRSDGPLLSSVGVNCELERPHVLFHEQLYYLFVSTHGHSFTDSHPLPSGLYGFTSPALPGSWTPLNGNGLVLGNPKHAPQAHYAWQVLPDMRIVSFANYPAALPGPIADDAAFAGTIPQFRHLRLEPAVSSVD